MKIKELIAKGARAYLAWTAQESKIENRDMVEQLMKQAMNSRSADEVYAIEQYANAFLADLYMNGRRVYELTKSESALINVTIELAPIKNKRWVDFNQELLNAEKNNLDMLRGALNRLCISHSNTERCVLFTSALAYMHRIIKISRERALEAEFGPRAEREADLQAQMTAMFK